MQQRYAFSNRSNRHGCRLPGQQSGQTLKQSFEAHQINPPDHAGNLAFVGGIQIAEPDRQALVQSRCGVVGIVWADRFIPVGLEFAKPCADAANQKTLKRAGQRGQNQSRPQLGGSARRLRQPDQDHITGFHRLSSGLMSASV